MPFGGTAPAPLLERCEKCGKLHLIDRCAGAAPVEELPVPWRDGKIAIDLMQCLARGTMRGWTTEMIRMVTHPHRERLRGYVIIDFELWCALVECRPY